MNQRMFLIEERPVNTPFQYQGKWYMYVKAHLSSDHVEVCDLCAIREKCMSIRSKLPILQDWQYSRCSKSKRSDNLETILIRCSVNGFYKFFGTSSLPKNYLKLYQKH